VTLRWPHSFPRADPPWPCRGQETGRGRGRGTCTVRSERIPDRALSSPTFSKLSASTGAFNPLTSIRRCRRLRFIRRFRATLPADAGAARCLCCRQQQQQQQQACGAISPPAEQRQGDLWTDAVSQRRRHRVNDSNGGRSRVQVSTVICLRRPVKRKQSTSTSRTSTSGEFSAAAAAADARCVEMRGRSA
jgi:hypothetical protein